MPAAMWTAYRCALEQQIKLAEEGSLTTASMFPHIMLKVLAADVSLCSCARAMAKQSCSVVTFRAARTATSLSPSWKRAMRSSSMRIRMTSQPVLRSARKCVVVFN